MKGMNSMTLSRETVMEAMQEYFDRRAICVAEFEVQDVTDPHDPHTRYDDIRFVLKARANGDGGQEQ